MKRKNKFIDNVSENQNSNKEIEKNEYSYQEKKKKNIINDLKQKGFNEIQIDDILETLIRNSISDRTPIVEDNNNLNKEEDLTIDTDIHSEIKIGKNNKKNKKVECINNNSKYKNSFIIKTENSESKKNNKNKSEYNCAKIYINASTEKDREYYLDSSENINENKDSKKILNFKKYKHVPHTTTHNNYAYTNSINSKKINTKFGNFINKFCSQHGNNTNRVEINRKEILKKFENEINDNYKNQRNTLYNNYNFKMIFDSKKFKDKDNMENIGYFEIKNNSSRELSNPMGKSRNKNIEENKTNSSNSFSLKQKILSSINQVSFDLNEIIEEKENNENNKDNEVKENHKNKDKDNKIKKSNEIEKEEKNNKKRNKGKFIAMKKKEYKMNKDKKNKQDILSNKFINTKKIFSLNNNNNRIPSGKNKKNSIFMIRKQKTEEEEKLAKKNIAIIEINQNDQKISKNNNNLHEKDNKSKSLSKKNIIENEKNNNKNFEINDDYKRSQSNYNHSFVNINLCKANSKNCSTFYKNRGFTINEKSNFKIRNYLHKEEIADNVNIKTKSSFENINLISNNNDKDLIYNKLSKAQTFINTDNNNSDNKNFKKVNHILFTSYNLKGKKTFNEVEIKSKSSIDNKLNDNISNINNIDIKKFINIKIEDNLNVYLKKIKKYENGIYEGIMLNDKREIKGTMIYTNGAKYEGQWRNDKKNGKGIFTSSHYFNCKYKVGMKYEGEFKDDKFDGYGVTCYTNGDKFEGEWKNNKQYGKGIVSYFDGSKYDGEWRDGKFDGIGIFYLKNGERFEGRFLDNKYNGYGKYYYNNGDYLEGIFKNDLPRGNCILHKSDGTTVNVQH